LIPEIGEEDPDVRRAGVGREGSVEGDCRIGENDGVVRREGDGKMWSEVRGEEREGGRRPGV